MQLLLQSSGGALAAVLVDHHDHVRQGVDLHLLRLQVVLKLLRTDTSSALSAVTYYPLTKLAERAHDTSGYDT